MAIAETTGAGHTVGGQDLAADGAETLTAATGITSFPTTPLKDIVSGNWYRIGKTPGQAGASYWYDTVASYNREFYSSTYANEMSNPVPAITPNATTREPSIWAEYQEPITKSLLGGGFGSQETLMGGGIDL
jgi:hypothetical protein